MARNKIRGKAGVKFKSPYTTSKRKSQLRTLVTHLIIHEKVEVTETTAISLVALADNMVTLAKKGGLSPYSRTSCTWCNSTCPIKPDVLFEGGNKIVDVLYNFTSPEHSILTTDKQFIDNYFSLSVGTSPATAQAANFAAQLQVKYPQLWVETIRGLIVHSAEWTDEMVRQFLPSRIGKKSYENILRACGYGVPNLQRALHSAKNSLVLIAQNEIQPYIFDDPNIKTNEMHLYELPWQNSGIKKSRLTNKHGFTHPLEGAINAATLAAITDLNATLLPNLIFGRISTNKKRGRSLSS